MKCNSPAKSIGNKFSFVEKDFTFVNQMV